MSDARDRVLRGVATDIAHLRAAPFVRVGVDGVDGAGKTTFADQLAELLRRTGERPIIRASVDDFHQPRAARYRRGRTSPEGFFRDSYDYAALTMLLLDPLSAGGSGRFRRAAFDLSRDQAVSAPEETAAPGAVLVVDGIFLHRPELRRYWDYSILLDVRFDVSIPRGAQRGIGSPDPAAEYNRRYIEGQRLYFRECTPRAYATTVLDNDDLARPMVLTRLQRPPNS